MKLNVFKKGMAKPLFTLEEARRVAWQTGQKTLNLELHQWVKSGELIRLKRGLYGFAGAIRDKTEVARYLYAPAYISLEFALHHYGLIPDVPFSVTLITPRIPRNFKTPFGEFSYRHIHTRLFWGFDPTTLMGEKEKVLADFLYFNSARLVPKPDCWETMRFQNLVEIDFNRFLPIAKRFGSKKVLNLAHSLAAFGGYRGKA